VRDPMTQFFVERGQKVSKKRLQEVSIAGDFV